jgi:hypothetical protein
MPRQVTMLGVFASCPQDLSAELKVLDTVIQELNPSLRDAYSVELRLITSGNFVVPGIGPDPQAVVNNQVADEYDIYIGMFGSQFGTPTPRAGSGTEEEFRRACDRWAKAPDSVRVLFYFKGTPDVAIQNLDLQQLAKVQEFKKSIAPKILYSEFKTTGDFVPLVRRHLWKLVSSEWDGNGWKSCSQGPGASAKPAETASVSVGRELARPGGPFSELEQTTEDETPGVLDAIVEAQDSIQAGTAALERIASITKEQTTKFEHHAKLISYVSANSQNPRDLKSAVDSAAEDLASYARSLRREIPALVAGFTSGFNAFDAATAAWIQEGPPDEQVLELRTMLEEVIPSLHSGQEPVIAFRDAIAGIPKLTSRLKKASRATRLQLDELIAGLAIISDRAVSTSSWLKRTHKPGS